MLIYPVPAMALMKAKSNYIMAPILQGVLNAIGIQWNLPRAVVYAPLKFQGSEVQSPYVESGIDHISMLMQETHKQSQMGQLLCMSIEATKVEIGISGSLFQQSYLCYGILATPSLIKNTWEFLSDHQWYNGAGLMGRA